MRLISLSEIEIITAGSKRQLLEFGNLTTGTWQIKPRIYTDEELDENREWRQFREQTIPEPKFQHTWRRFSYKVQAQIEHCYYNTGATHVAWIDLDVVQVNPIDWNTLLPNKNTDIAYLERTQQHPDTGIIIYNLQRTNYFHLFNTLEHYYLDNKLFDLPEWHDAFIWDYCCRLHPTLNRQTLTTRTVSKGEVFYNSDFKDKLVHLKGDRKQWAKAVIEQNISPQQATLKPKH